MLNLDDSVFPILSTNKLSYLLREKRGKIEKIASKAGLYYKPFILEQPKKDGTIKERKIDNPTGELKTIQLKINRNLLRPIMLNMPTGMIGGIAGKSIRNNAMEHIDQDMVVTIDLKDCFPRTSYKRVFQIWRNLLGSGEDVSRILTQLTTFHRKLPQGAPTSLCLCNLALLPLFEEIEKFANSASINFTLYVDDMAISGDVDSCQKAIDPIIDLIKEHGYAVRRKKIKIMPRNTQQQVTGINVNKKASIAIERRESIREEILQLSRSHETSRKEIEKLRGKITFVTSVDATQGEKLERFAKALLPALDLNKIVN